MGLCTSRICAHCCKFTCVLFSKFSLSVFGKCCSLHWISPKWFESNVRKVLPGCAFLTIRFGQPYAAAAPPKPKPVPRGSLDKGGALTSPLLADCECGPSAAPATAAVPGAPGAALTAVVVAADRDRRAREVGQPPRSSCRSTPRNRVRLLHCFSSKMRSVLKLC
jgi:hypothetical protein